MDKQKVINSLSINAKRELEVLSNYCTIDYENKIVIVPIRFNSASDLIVTNMGSKERPIINSEIFQDMSEIIHCVPDTFDVSFDFAIADYSEYTPECMMQATQNGLEIFSYNVKKQMNANGVKKSLLIAAGVIIFAWLFIICSLKIFGEEEITHNIVHEIVYTVACVLLWEGIYILFLPDSEYNGISYSILRKIRDIAFLDKNQKVLIKRSIKELKKDWVHETVWEKRFRRAFLASATGYFCIALCSLPEIIPCIKNIATDSMNLIILILTIINTIVFLFTAVAELSFYNGHGPLIKHIIPLNAVSFVLIVTVFIVHIINFAVYGKTSIFWFIVSVLLFIVAILGLCGAIALTKEKRKN